MLWFEDENIWIILYRIVSLRYCLYIILLLLHSLIIERWIDWIILCRIILLMDIVYIFYHYIIKAFVDQWILFQQIIMYQSISIRWNWKKRQWYSEWINYYHYITWIHFIEYWLKKRLVIMITTLSVVLTIEHDNMHCDMICFVCN